MTDQSIHRSMTVGPPSRWVDRKVLRAGRWVSRVPRSLACQRGLACGPSGQKHPDRFRQRMGGRSLVLDGKAADAADWSIHKAVEEQDRSSLEGYFGWHYPPTFLLWQQFFPATLPTCVSGLDGAHAAAYAAVIRMIVARRIGSARLCVPGCAVEYRPGRALSLQPFSAARWVDEAPAFARVFLGLLGYKPHFGLLFRSSSLWMGAGGCSRRRQSRLRLLRRRGWRSARKPSGVFITCRGRRGGARSGRATFKSCRPFWHRALVW